MARKAFLDSSHKSVGIREIWPPHRLAKVTTCLGLMAKRLRDTMQALHSRSAVPAVVLVVDPQGNLAVATRVAVPQASLVVVIHVVVPQGSLVVVIRVVVPQGSLAAVIRNRADA